MIFNYFGDSIAASAYDKKIIKGNFFQGNVGDLESQFHFLNLMSAIQLPR